MTAYTKAYRRVGFFKAPKNQTRLTEWAIESNILSQEILDEGIL